MIEVLITKVVSTTFLLSSEPPGEILFSLRNPPGENSGAGNNTWWGLEKAEKKEEEDLE